MVQLQRLQREGGGLPDGQFLQGLHPLLRAEGLLDSPDVTLASEDGQSQFAQRDEHSAAPDMLTPVELIMFRDVTLVCEDVEQF